MLTACALLGLTWRPKPCSQEQAFEAMRAALKSGANFWNGGQFYGPPDYNSLVLLERYFEKYPEDADKVVLSIKGGVGLDGRQPDGSAEGIRRSVDGALAQLKGRKKIDLFECARRDQNVDMKETFGELQRYVDEGKLGGISLSEVRAETIHEAVRVAKKIEAVEVELSLFSTEVLENGVAAACAQHGIPLVAYSPLGRGMLTGQIRRYEDLPEDDMRRHYPRFSPENFGHNITLVHKVEELSTKRGVTPGQFALAWVRTLQKRPGMPVIIPIPGATTAERVDENSKVVDLSDDEMAIVDGILDKMDIKGARYPTYVPVDT